MGSEHANVLKVMARIEREGASARISMAQAVALIASKIRGDEEPRAVKKRIRERMRRSHKKGTDVITGGLACGPDRYYTVDEIVRWARTRYPGSIDHLPTIGRTLDTVTIADGIGFGANADQEVMPGNLPECQAELLKTRVLLKNARWELEETKLDCERRLKLYANFFGKLP
jgi:hypothetical protein